MLLHKIFRRERYIWFKKNSVAIEKASIDYNKCAATNFLNKVTEKDEKFNTAKYIRIQVWSKRYAAQFRSLYVFPLLIQNFFQDVELKKSHRKGSIDGLLGKR